MKVENIRWEADTGWSSDLDHAGDLKDANFVLYFGGQGTLDDGSHYQELKDLYPNAHIMGCSTGGEISGDEVIDDSIVASAVKLEKSTMDFANIEIEDAKESFNVGKEIAQKLIKDNLKNIFILSDGLNVNGSELVKGLVDVVGNEVILTGGLAGDGADFGKTFVGLDQAPTSSRVVAVGFSGDDLNVSYGSFGGWDNFGPERTVTRSEGNVLFELDDRPALELYKEYLGEEAEKLPGSGLLFPLNIKPNTESKDEIVRTIIGIDEEQNSLIFAGDVPEGYIARLMKGNFDNLVDGAAHAAEKAEGNNDNESLAVLVSCIGRKLLLGQMISDEVEAVVDTLGEETNTIGFYSYGEICPFGYSDTCGLHNQTMTITTMSEK